MATADGVSLGVYGIMFQPPCAAGSSLIEAPDEYVKPNRQGHATLVFLTTNCHLGPKEAVPMVRTSTADSKPAKTSHLDARPGCQTTRPPKHGKVLRGD